MLIRRHRSVNVPAVVENTAAENSEDKKEKYSKTDINRMSAEDLKALAPTLGIKVTDESKGTELKARIIEALGL